MEPLPTRHANPRGWLHGARLKVLPSDDNRVAPTVPNAGVENSVDYWQTHYLFGMPSAYNAKHFSSASCDLIIINTVCPILFAYGIDHHDEQLEERAITLLEQLKPEQNFIIRQWRQCGLTVANAADSQALIQLKREYCDRRDCLRCRIAYEYLKGMTNNV